MDAAAAPHQPQLTQDRERRVSGGAPLASQQLLVLQLRARGYSDAQLAQLLGRTARDVRILLTHAAAAIGEDSVSDAIGVARRSGLLG
jgi:DNA-binding CsgD family transcriptional regulator